MAEVSPPDGPPGVAGAVEPPVEPSGVGSPRAPFGEGDMNGRLGVAPAETEAPGPGTSLPKGVGNTPLVAANATPPSMPAASTAVSPKRADRNRRERPVPGPPPMRTSPASEAEGRAR